MVVTVGCSVIYRIVSVHHRWVAASTRSLRFSEDVWPLQEASSDPLQVSITFKIKDHFVTSSEVKKHH